MAHMKWAGQTGLLWRRMRLRSAGRLVSSLSLGLILLSALLGACAQDTSAAADRAHQAQARLDQEMQTARTHLHVPDGLLQPIIDQEHTLTAGTKPGTVKAY